MAMTDYRRRWPHIFDRERFPRSGFTEADWNAYLAEQDDFDAHRRRRAEGRLDEEAEGDTSDPRSAPPALRCHVCHGELTDNETVFVGTDWMMPESWGDEPDSPTAHLHLACEQRLSDEQRRQILYEVVDRRFPAIKTLTEEP
jgi:hypothetical protein